MSVPQIAWQVPASSTMRPAPDFGAILGQREKSGGGDAACHGISSRRVVFPHILTIPFMSKPLFYRIAVIAFIFIIIAGTTPKIFAQGAGCGGAGQKQNVTNSGTQFLLCFERNDVVGRFDGDDGYLEIYLASLSDTATVTITCNQFPTMNKVFQLAGNDTAVYRISTDFPDLWITSDEDTDNRVVQVASSAPIVCYGMNHKVNTTDAFLALPESSAGTDYRILSYPNSTIIDTVFNEEPSQFAVAAFTDNTDVTITPSARTELGHVAGAPFTVTLRRGQCIQVQTHAASYGLDLTGSEVRADKPVAVYGSHARAEIPWNYTQTNGSTSRDILLEAMPPVDAWGKVFVLSALDLDNAGNKRPQGDLMRVLALNANTTVTVNGKSWVTLGADQWADSLIHGPVIVEASQPVLVGEYAHTSTVAGDNGDPFLAVVPSVDQTFNNYTFFASSDPVFSLQKVIIATDTAAQSSIVFDNGSVLPSSAFTPLVASSDGRKFALIEFGVQAGAHTLRTNQLAEHGFTILMYGLGPVDSYGYTAGILLKPLTTLLVNPTPTASFGRHSNEIDFHNTTNAGVYLDSAVFTPDNGQCVGFGIHSQENVALGIGRLDIAQAAQIHLVSDVPLTAPVSGVLRIYSHTPQWNDIHPSETSYTLYPDALADVSNGNTTHTIEITNYPNPFSAYTTISFSLPGSGDLSIVLYDELGRVVRRIASGEFPAGPYSIRFDRDDLPAGFYTCQVVSERLNIKERMAIVAGE